MSRRSESAEAGVSAPSRLMGVSSRRTPSPAARSDMRPIDPARMVSPKPEQQQVGGQGTPSELQLRPDRRQVSVLLNDDELERLSMGRN